MIAACDGVFIDTTISDNVAFDVQTVMSSIVNKGL